MKQYKNPVCKGSKQLGTACGSCERCVDDIIADAKLTIPPLLTQTPSSTTHYFLVGRWPDNNEDKVWEVQGVYNDEIDAQLACQDYLWFVMPVEKNTPLPLTSEVVGYYPNNKLVV